MKTFQLLVRETQTLAHNIKGFNFVRADGVDVSGISPGSHIVLHLPNGTSRRYSLTNAPDDTDAYKIAVLRDSESRGASKYLHKTVNEGTLVHASGPFNHLPVNAHASHSLLIAGGIGITPIISIAQYLHSIGQSFKLYYCARSRDHAAFVEQIDASEFRSSVRYHFTDGDSGQRLNLSELISTQTPETHIYYCGPGSMMNSIDKAIVGWDENRVHSEDFGGSSINNCKAKEFEVEIFSTGQKLLVPASRSLMEVLWENGYPIDHVCEEGICGSCMVDVLSGTPDHRDDFQTSEEKCQNNMIATCCSRSVGSKLVLDL